MSATSDYLAAERCWLVLQDIFCSCPLRPCRLALCWSRAGCERGGTLPAPSRVAGTAWLMAVRGDLSSCCVIPHHPGMTQDVGMVLATDEWLVSSTCSSGYELAETFSQAVLLLWLRCAWISDYSKAAWQSPKPPSCYTLLSSKSGVYSCRCAGTAPDPC